MKENFAERVSKTELWVIRDDVTNIENFYAKEGLPFKKPLLVLGIFERVGSNWLLDTLNRHVHTHNEPFKQQLGKSSVYSTMSNNIKNINDVKAETVDPFLSYWLETFVSTKYGDTDHVVKETNLFFAIENFSQFFPDAPALILKREPVGIISSLLDQDLYTKWGYKERYEQLRQVTSDPQLEKFRFVFNETNTKELSPVVVLTRLIFLNALLIALSLKDKKFKELSYEASVVDRAEVLRFLSSEIFSGKEFSDTKQDVSIDRKNAEGIFSTKRSKNKLEAFLEKEDEQEVFSEMERLIFLLKNNFSVDVVSKVERFLTSNKKSYKLIGRKNLLQNQVQRQESTVDSMPAPIEFIQDKTNINLEWRNTLVNNSEFCSFLNELKSQGVNNIFDGAQMFFNENMIHDRGGRIHFNQITKRYEVSVGYKNHPVYWVTWIGAMAFAVYKGLCLPTRVELEALFKSSNIDLSNINAGHKLDDVHPNTVSSYVHEEVNDLVGNLAAWCLDGKVDVSNSPESLTRYIYGTAWNRPATVEEINKIQTRPLVGNSRGVGVRLIRDKYRTPSILFEELIQILKNIPSILKEGSHLSLSERDRAIISLFNK